MKSKPKQKKGTGAKRVVKAWTIARVMSNWTVDLFAMSGILQQPVFLKKKDAVTEAKRWNMKVFQITVIYSLPSTKLTKSKKK